MGDFRFAPGDWRADVRRLAVLSSRPSAAMSERATDLLTRAEAAYQAAVADPASAGAAAADIVDAAQETGDIEAYVVGLRAQAWCARALLDDERARRILHRAARAAEAAGLETRLAEVLVVRSAVNEELGATRSAERDLERARVLLKDKAPPALALQAAVMHQNAGRLVDASAIYRRTLRRGDLPVDVRAKMANNLAMLEAQRGRYDVALALTREARSLASHVGPAVTAYFAESEAAVLAHAGRLPESLQLFDEAQRLYEAAGLPVAELHADAADAMLDLRLLPEARAAADRAAREFTIGEVPLMRAEAELRVARVALNAGDLDDARRAADVALASFRWQRRQSWAARAAIVGVEARMGSGTATREDVVRARRAAATLDRLGMPAEAVDAHLTAGRAAAAIGRDAWAASAFDRAHELARSAAVLTRLRGRLAAASAATLRGDPTGVVQHCRKGLADLDRHRGQLGSTELRVLASAHGVELGQLALGSLRTSSTPAKVFAWLERNRAAALTPVQTLPVDGFVEDFEELRSMSAELQASGSASPALAARHAALEQHLRRLTWSASHAYGTPAQSTSTADLQALLDDRTLVEYGILDSDILAAVVTERHISVTTVASTSVVRSELDKLGFSLRRLLRTPGSPAQPALLTLATDQVSRLRSLLVAPLALEPGRELVVVPVDFLQSVPWPALVDAPVALSPSGHFWASARLRPTPAANRVLLAAGPGLAGAQEEVRRLSELHDRSDVLFPPESTVARVTEALTDATTAHFACHGAVRADNPMFSGLILSDGNLTVQELELRGLAPHRVVLAACEAAADVTYAGGELLGFVSALIARGTAGVLGSLLLVPDEATTALMLGVHERLRGDVTLVNALHGARGELDLDHPADFVNWCGFAAYGAA